MTNMDTPEKDDVLHLSIIMQGLLASGHYTTQDHEESYLQSIPEIRKYDWGKEGVADGMNSRRFESCVIGDAIELLEELKEKLHFQKLQNSNEP